MSYEEQFDKIIRQKAEELHYSFDEANWEKAAKMLDEERRAVPVKGAGAMYFRMAAVVTVAGLFTALLYFAPFNSTTDQLAGKKSPGAAPAAVEQQGSAVLDHERDRAATISAELPVQTKSEVQPASEPPALTTQVSSAGPIVAETMNEAPPVPVASQEAIPVSGNNEAPIENKALVAAQSETPEAQKVQPLESPVAAAEEALPAEEIAIHHLEPVSGILPGEESTESEVSMPAFIYDDYYSPKNGRSGRLDLEAGIAYMPGWPAAGAKDGAGLNWFGGLNYAVHVGRNILVTTGLQAYRIGNISRPFYGQEDIHYDFGSSTTGTLVVSDQLQYAAMPLLLTWEPQRTSALSLGVNIAWLVQASNTVISYKLLDNERIYQPATTSTGIYEGVNRLNVSLAASYAAAISKRVSLKGEFLYGLSDVFVNNKFNSELQQPAAFRFSLQYRICSK